MASKRVAVYFRVSTLEQSTELQKIEIQRYLEARNWPSALVYEDKATGTNINRPELKRLLADARQRKFDLIVCWKLDRLFRSLTDLVVTLQELQELGIEFISLKENIDLTTASGRLLMQLMGAMAEFEASLIRERVCAGLRAARAKGTRLGRPPSIDYDEVLKLRKQNKSLGQIAMLLGITKGGVSKSLKKMSLDSRHKQVG